MKTYKHKQTGWIAKDIFMKPSTGGTWFYKIYEDYGYLKYRYEVPASLIEGCSDWEEVTEPQEEVIEGWVRKYAANEFGFVFLKIQSNEKDSFDDGIYKYIPARLIINPKHKKHLTYEYSYEIDSPLADGKATLQIIDDHIWYVCEKTGEKFVDETLGDINIALSKNKKPEMNLQSFAYEFFNDRVVHSEDVYFNSNGFEIGKNTLIELFVDFYNFIKSKSQ